MLNQVSRDNSSKINTNTLRLAIVKYEFRHLAAGGTFDFLHKGHRAFLDYAFARAEYVTLGITTDELVKTQGKNDVSTLAIRLAGLEKFLRENNYDQRSEIVLLDDIYGPAVNSPLDAILVTIETKKNAMTINKKRQEKGLPPVKIVVFPIINAEDGEPISSTKIKSGEIDTGGKLYFSKIKNRNYHLPKKLRGELSKPWGEIFKNFDDLYGEVSKTCDLLISVGDRTTANFLKKGVVPKISIIDLIIERKKVFNNPQELGFKNNETIIKIKNPAATIKSALTSEIKKMLADTHDKRFVVLVAGEEDLAVIPAVILAPIGFAVVYGQRQKGLVLVKVTPKSKADFLRLLAKFKSS